MSKLFASEGQSIGISALAISPSNECSGLLSFRMDWLDLLAVQGTLKSLLQHHSSKASILRSSAFFIVQLSHPYMTTGKTIALASIVQRQIVFESYYYYFFFSSLYSSSMRNSVTPHPHQHLVSVPVKQSLGCFGGEPPDFGLVV